MKSFRESLSANFLKNIEREVGREESLRLLWPVIVGRRLANNTRLHRIQNGRLILAVPDRSWRVSLGSDDLEKMILDAVNSLWGETVCHSIEFFEDPRVAPPLQEQRNRRSQPFREPPPVELPAAETVADVSLRKLIVQSASKYLARREESSQEENSQEENSR